MSNRTVTFTIVLFLGLAVGAGILFVRAPERVNLEYRPDDAFSRYRYALHDVGIDESDIGARWLAVGEQVLEHSEARRADGALVLPLRETIVFDPAEPQAATFRFSVARRREVTIGVDTQVRPPRLFADLYRLPADASKPAVKVASLDPRSGELRFRTRRDGWYLFRLQPELARGGRVTVSITQQ
ncbi:MAG: hypothetical protein EA384_04680 [Spirochaetaceae bacterium]|nr:MAG: hypothetical protein EA384_04680 [Spirochaetaceae bacterium]